LAITYRISSDRLGTTTASPIAAASARTAPKSKATVEPQRSQIAPQSSEAGSAPTPIPGCTSRRRCRAGRAPPDLLPGLLYPLPSDRRRGWAAGGRRGPGAL